MTENKILASGYSEAGASTERRALKGFDAASGSASDDLNENNATLRQRSRMLYMSSPLATSAINTNRTKVIGVGLSIKTHIDRDILGMGEDAAKSWQSRVEREFAIWAEKKQNCDALGLSTFNGLQQLALKSWLMSGDVFAVIKRAAPTAMNPYSLRLHLIEADRVSTPGWAMKTGGYAGITEGVVPKGKPGAGHAIHDGVEVDEGGRVIAYYIANRHPGALIYAAAKTKWTRVEAYDRKTGEPNVLHVMEAERPEQYRGIPYLAQVIEPLLQMRRYTESELMAAIVQSFFTAWIETDTEKSEFPLNDTLDEPEESRVPKTKNEYHMGMGTVIHLNPGEKVVFGKPEIPTAGFDTFVKVVARQIGTALEIPYDVLMKEFNSSYSASRGALLEAWEAFRMRRVWFVESFCRPIYELWLAEAVARGRIKAPGFWDDPLIREAYAGAHWIGPVQGQLDPKKEAEAALALATHGVKTFAQIARELGGGNFDENAEQLKHENDLLKAAGVALGLESDPADPSDPDGNEPGNNA